MNYYQPPILSNVYLEDSYALSILEKNDSLILELDAVLTETHPSYSPPKDGETYCYRRASLVFSKIKLIEWKSKSFVQCTDASGEFDYGNIDTFSLRRADCWSLSGDWGGR